MKKASYLFFLLSILSLFSANAQKKAQVWVLGTVHFETENIKVDSIFNAVETYQPDIILLESDMSNFNDDYSLKRFYNELEWITMKNYVEKYPNTLVRPYEYEGRNTYRSEKGIQNVSDIYNKLYILNKRGRLTKEQSQTYNTFLSLVDSLNKVGKKSLSVINRFETDNLVYERQFYQYAKSLEIAKNIPYFSTKTKKTKSGEEITLLEKLKRYCHFETYRNKVMSNNILKWAKKYPGKKILVFTGFYHKVFLEQYLKWEQKNSNFTLIKYKDVINEN